MIGLITNMKAMVMVGLMTTISGTAGGGVEATTQLGHLTNPAIINMIASLVGTLVCVSTLLIVIVMKAQLFYINCKAERRREKEEKRREEEHIYWRKGHGK